MITTIEEAESTLDEVVMDVIADHGEEAVEAAWRDLVVTVADRCDRDTAIELMRRNGFDYSSYL